jgi:hypothetical protein
VTGDDAAVDAAAARHGFSRAAVSALWDALRRGGGRMAQFSHPELGGMGQWSGGGMLQIGAMFDHALKARVADLCADLAEAASRSPSSRGVGPAARGVADDAADWWPSGLGRPSASGSQDGTRYAYFAEARRLAVDRAGAVTLYDTGRHRIFGVSQSRSRGPHLAFTADDGTVDLDGLAVVGP